MKARPGRVLGAALGLAACVLALETAAWWWLGSQVLTQFAAWQAAENAAGLQVTTGSARHAGWPWHAVVPVADIRVADVTIASPNGGAWHTGELRLLFRLWRPGVVTAIPTGPQLVHLGATAIQLAARQLAATIPLQPGPTTLMPVEGQDVVAKAGAQSVSVERLALQLGAASLNFDAAGVTLPAGGTVQSVSGGLQATAPLPPAPDWRAALARWQRGGNQLHLTDLKVQWGALDAQGDAVGGLTPGLQPEGTGRLQLTGFSEALAAAQRVGALTPDAARVAAAVLGLLARTEPGKPPEVDLPWRLHDGVLSAGAIPLLRVPDFMPH